MHPYLRSRLSVHMLLCGAITGAWQPVLPAYLKGLGFGETGIAIALATAPVATMISPLLLGQAPDRWYSSERLQAGTSFVGGLLLLLARGCTGFPAFVGVFFAAMLTTVATFPMATSIALQNLEDGPRQFPAVRAFGTIGHVLGANVLSGWMILTGRGLADSLTIAGILAIAAAAYTLTLPHTPPRHDAAGRSAVGKTLGMLRDPGFALFIGVLFLLSIFGTAYYARGPIFVLESGIRSEHLSALFSLGQAAEVLVVFLLPAIYGRCGARGTIAIGMAAWSARYFLFAWSPALGPLALAILLHGICFGCGRIAATIYVDRICARDARASAQSLLSLLVDGSGALLGNVIIERAVTRFTAAGVTDWRSVWLVPALGCATAFVVFVLGFRSREAQPRPV